MFGCCVAGRLLQTNLQQIDDTHAVFELPGASSINHICVFLLGTVPFPDGFGATVHFLWPGKGVQLLGMLSNEKPSAIFRLRGQFSPSDSSSIAQNTFSTYASPAAQADVTATLGIAIEPLSQIQQQMEAIPNALAKPAQDLTKDPTWLAERIVRHLMNYVSSFTPGTTMTQDLAIPMGVIAKWYEIFMGKVKAGGIGFLERG